MRWKRVALIASGVVVVLIVAGYVVLSSYDFNQLKPEIARKVKEATGRNLTIGGNIRLRVGLSPALSVEDVALQNAPWSSRPEMARIKSVEGNNAKLNDAVPAIVELQLQQGEDLRNLIIEDSRKSESAKKKMKQKPEALVRSERNAQDAADALKDRP